MLKHIDVDLFVPILDDAYWKQLPGWGRLDELLHVELENRRTDAYTYV